MEGVETEVERMATVDLIKCSAGNSELEMD